LALGKPVIAHVSDELFDKYKPPIFRTTAENFKRDLVTLLKDVRERKRLGIEGLRYVQNHSVKRVEEKLQKYYDSIL
jgi:glycosyltransferase involved in cell wall biosynthesis